jgi:serine/threonine protein kinase
MDPDDVLDDLVGSVSDGLAIDWERSDSAAADPASLRAVHDLERIAEYHRRLQRAPLADRARTEGAGMDPVAGVRPPEPWGHLALLELASAGASGEVWRAWDTWLQRDVALKFLSSSAAPARGTGGDAALLEEARALARVRHAGVVAVYGIADHDGRAGMWMELLQGRTLAEEIERRGALPADEVARIGVDLCRALAAVETAGLVHRDIKPANIVLEASGRVVLTDFGLGRRRALAEMESWRSSGTPMFMAPELLGGAPATARSDLYALGVTLRWALTGKPPFSARTLDELKAQATAGPAEPLTAEGPAARALVGAIERAMAPEVDARFGSAAQMAAALERGWAVETGTSSRRPGRLRIAGVAALALLLGAALGAGRFVRSPAPAPLVRFTVKAPPNTVLSPNVVAISPDGRLLALVATDSVGVQRLWVRPLDALVSNPLAGTEGGDLPFWSPDSRHLGFFADGKLKRAAVAGGEPEIVCNALDSRGGTWGKNGVIVFAPKAAGPLCRVSERGGPVTEVLRPDSTRKETALRWPHFLPDGNHFLFVALPPRDGTFEVCVGALDSPERKPIFTAGTAALYGGPHGLVVASNGRLLCQAFDTRRLRTVGEPEPLGPAPSFDVSVGMPLVSVSANGVLARPTSSLADTRLVWLDREGNRRDALAVPEGRYERLYVSPDGRRALAERRTSPTLLDLWMVDLAQGQATRFTQGSQSRLGGRPVWSPDGSHIAFSSNRQGTTNIYTRPTSGIGEEELLYHSDAQFKEVNSWSPDGRYLVFEQADPVTGWDLWLLPMGDDRKPIPYLRTRFGEVAASISPDGRWLAYCSDATGRPEVYVRSFPVPGVEHRVTKEGGTFCSWRQDGRELLVLNPLRDHAVWSVPVSTAPTFEAGESRLLFRSPLHDVWLAPAPDGTRFLESIPAEEVEPTSIAVDLNWPALLGR